jgi:hypothetical protein
MNEKALMACTVSGPLGFLLFGIGIWPLAGFLPPLAPSATAAEIAAIYRDHQLGIRLGSVLVMFAASMFVPFWAAISVFLKKLEPALSPYAYTQLASGTIVAAFFFLGALLFAVTAFRPDRPEELTQMMNDFAWILFITPGAPAFFQTIAIGFAILQDKSAVPVLPRWAGYLSIWVAVLFVPAGLGVVFKTGPFAWNGIITFWIPAVLVGAWSNVMAMLMIGHLKKVEV